MDTPAASIETLVAKAEQFGKTSIELCKLKAIHKSADVISSMAVRLTIIAFVVLFCLMLTVAVALLIGDFLGKSYYGFFILAGIYALAGFIFYYFRNKWIKAPIQNSIIFKALN